MTTQLVIFDCDGVLVDSETIGNEVLRDVIAELGWELSLREVLQRFKGGSIVDIWRTVEARIGRPITDREHEEFRRRQYALFKNRLQPLAGVRETIARLNIPYCVASNGPHEKMQVTLATAGLLDAFAGRIFSRVDVPRPKPHPDLFLYAAAQMGVDPAHSLVVEDSPLGVTAALAAGMRAVGFCGTATADETALRAAGSSVILYTMQDLPQLL